jgi:hypothetical protein
MAVAASRGTVLSSIFRRALTLAASGIVLGVVASTIAVRALTGLLLCHSRRECRNVCACCWPIDAYSARRKLESSLAGSKHRSKSGASHGISCAAILMSSFRRISNFSSRSGIHQEIYAKLQSHIEMRIEENVAKGMSPGEARRDALLSLEIQPSPENAQPERMLP